MNKFHSVKNKYAVVCDLDGTLLYPEKEAIAVNGRSGVSFMARDTALLLARISRLVPLVIATGRNAVSTQRLVKELPRVHFAGFVLENGFTVKKNIFASIHYRKKWENIASLFPSWERLRFYENCVGFIPPDAERETAAESATRLLQATGFNVHVCREHKKIFIYPGRVDKMRGIAMLGVEPYIAMGDAINDLQMLAESFCPVTRQQSIEPLKAIVAQKNGFCSSLHSHGAACDMLEFTYRKILNVI